MAKPSSYRDENIAETFKQILPGLLKIAAVVVAIGLVLWGVTKLTSSNDKQFTYNEIKKPFDIVRPYNPSVGLADSKVVVLIVQDPQCPNCSIYDDIAKVVKNKYKDRVNFVTKFMPLENIHAFARAGSQALYAAQKQGKFTEYSDLVFKEQSKLNLNQLDEWAKTVGLNVDQFKRDRADKEIDFWIASDVKDLNAVRLPADAEHATPPQPGVEAGRLTGTPSTVIFVNGEVFDWWSGAAQQEQLETAIEKALTKVSGKTESSSSSSVSSSSSKSTSTSSSSSVVAQ